MAARGSVLLQNHGALPVRFSDEVHTIAVVGAQAAAPIIVGGGSGAVGTRFVSTPLDAIRARVQKVPGAAITYSDGRNVTNATLSAASADRVLIFVGTSSREGADRADLRLGAQVTERDRP